jgi:hypothetical protein
MFWPRVMSSRSCFCWSSRLSDFRRVKSCAKETGSAMTVYLRELLDFAQGSLPNPFPLDGYAGCFESFGQSEVLTLPNLRRPPMTNIDQFRALECGSILVEPAEVRL